MFEAHGCTDVGGSCPQDPNYCPKCYVKHRKAYCKDGIRLCAKCGRKGALEAGYIVKGNKVYRIGEV